MKTALFVEGGGMKCAYSAGVLDVFLDENINFDYCMGVSAGAAAIASFQAGQRERNMRYFCQHVKDPNYLSLSSFVRTGNYFGLQYIYGDMTNEGGIDPLDYDAMMANPSEMYFPATNAVTGKMRYFSKQELKRNHYEPIMATCALPVMCQPVEVDGEYYFDGGVGDSIPIDKMLADGCDKIVAVMSKKRGYRMKPQGMKMGYHMALHEKYPKTIELLDKRHLNWNASMDKLIHLQRQNKALIFYLPDEIEIGTYTSDPAVMTKLYELGLRDARNNAVLVKGFLKKDK